MSAIPSNDGGALIKQIAEAFRDKEEVDALLEKEKKARLRAEKALEDAEKDRVEAVACKDDLEAQIKKLEDGKEYMNEIVADERQKRFQAEKNVERLLYGLKDELLDSEEAPRCQGDLRQQLGVLQDAARRLQRELQTEKSDGENLQGTVTALKQESQKAEADKAAVENELEEARSKLKKIGELKSQIDITKDQARREVEEARQRGREEAEQERIVRERTEAMYQEALKNTSKYDQERRAVVLEAEALQKSLDTELDRCQKLMEDKRQLENERKEYDKLRAQADANVESIGREMDEVKDDISRLRTMLDEEKKQRNIAEEAWKEYSKRLHTERTLYSEPHGRLPNDDEIMDTVYCNINGLERDSSDEEMLSQSSYSQRARQLAPKPNTAMHQPSLQQARRGKPKTKYSGPRNMVRTPMMGGSSEVSMNPADGDSMRKLQPIVVPPQSPLQQARPPSVFPSGGFVQMPRSLRSPHGPVAYSDNASMCEDPLNVNPAHVGPGSYPTVGQLQEGQNPRRVTPNRLGWMRHFNPLRVRNNPVGWLWSRRRSITSGVTHGVSYGVGSVTHTGAKIAQNVWTWVIIVVLVVGSAGLKDDESNDEKARVPKPSTPTSQPSTPVPDSPSSSFKAASFAG